MHPKQRILSHYKKFCFESVNNLSRSVLGSLFFTVLLFIKAYCESLNFAVNITLCKHSGSSKSVAIWCKIIRAQIYFTDILVRRGVLDPARDFDSETVAEVRNLLALSKYSHLDTVLYDSKKSMHLPISYSQNEYKLVSVPDASISAVKFGPTSSQFIIASSWDTCMRLYDVWNNRLILKCLHDSPVLDCCFQDSTHAWSGGLDCKVRSFDLTSNTGTHIGDHDLPIRCVEHCPDLNIVITGSWDRTVKLWDSRSGLTAGKSTQPDKVYAMAVCGYKLIVGTAGRRVLIWDLRNMGHEEQHRESSLKFQTRCIKSFPSEQGFVLSSIEGRVAVEYLDTSADVQKMKYAFKCHRRRDINGVEQIYPVNSMSFHMGYHTCATGGSDGFVNIWDCLKKRHLTQFHRYPTGISSLSFSPCGTLLAIASSYLYELELPKNEIPSSIYIRHVTEEEVKPK